MAGRPKPAARASAERAPAARAPAEGVPAGPVRAEDRAGFRPEGQGVLELGVLVAEIDRLIAATVDEILHHPRLQRLEALWRGVRFLVDRVDADDPIEIRIAHWTWREVCRDLAGAIEFDQSCLFAALYTSEFGMPGGRPFGVVVADYAILHRQHAGHPTDDISALGALAQIAAAAFVPVVLTCEPEFLGVGSFGELAGALHLAETFRSDDYARWRRLQETPDARFLALALPRFLLRRPYRDDGVERHGFRYNEETGAPGARHYLWGHAGFALAAVLIRAFCDHGWFADIAGVHRDLLIGGLVDRLPVEAFETDRPGTVLKAMTEVTLTAQRAQDLDALGIIVLAPCKDTPLAAFSGLPSLHRPAHYTTPIATTNARLTARLQYLFCVSRFAHCIKVMMRDRLGGFTTPEECASRLSQWIADYKTSKTNASPLERALAPLQDARVRVAEVPGRPGALACTFWLRPHFQPADVVSSFRVVTEVLPRPKP